MVRLSSQAPPDLPAASVSADVFECADCPRAFPTEVQLKSHRAKLHAYRNPLHYLITGTVCIRCSVDFHSRTRLYKHVYRMILCHDHYHNVATPMSELELCSIEGAMKLVKTDCKAIMIPPVLVVPA